MRLQNRDAIFILQVTTWVSRRGYYRLPKVLQLWQEVVYTIISHCLTHWRLEVLVAALFWRLEVVNISFDPSLEVAQYSFLLKKKIYIMSDQGQGLMLKLRRE